jgi:hypoxanthine phosphoribosyltransferase
VGVSEVSAPDSRVGKILFSAEQIAERVSELGSQISADYQGKPLVLLGVLNGSAVFLSDLARAVSMPLEFSFVGLSSYKDATESCGQVCFTKPLETSFHGKHVLAVEDIIDTGLTIVQSNLRQAVLDCGAESFEVCALLDKPTRRVAPVEARYVGFVIEDHFVVGYGLDCAGLYRNLPFVAVLVE